MELSSPADHVARMGGLLSESLRVKERGASHGRLVWLALRARLARGPRKEYLLGAAEVHLMMLGFVEHKKEVAFKVYTREAWERGEYDEDEDEGSETP